MDAPISLQQAQAKIRKEGNPPFTVLLRHGSMRTEYFAPSEVDTQTPHPQDEVYVIISGEAVLNRAGEMVQCHPNDLIFIPAGMPHFFEVFSADFATWAILYGPTGGESA
ncbi:cupin domain-containing protein [Hymenobacter sp. BT635]|uniref:Cupin domain-containing protein n=1 Tax=Hymenobacter nitidus TaxID=2880929 RepID=A0ABS8AFL9_9BACT|nr:cupin domain-containing protein [Hymenobacter nitidus]MCB2378244.1 cupin domain-containing protein [Hymenobacter nitidus]